MCASLFNAYGQLCAKYPWEVILTVVTITILMFAEDHFQFLQIVRANIGFKGFGYTTADIYMRNLIRLLAIVCTTYQIIKLHRKDSNYILTFVGFLMSLNYTFMSAILNFLKIDCFDPIDTIFLFLLLTNMTKAALMIDFALGAPKSEDVEKIIAIGMEIIGPVVAIDTLVESMVFGIGMLSGDGRLERISCIACFAIIADFTIFVTIYPAALSLLLQLSNNTYNYERKYSKDLMKYKEIRLNPVMRWIKCIMASGMMVVYVNNWWPCKINSEHFDLNKQFNSSLQNYIIESASLSIHYFIVLTIIASILFKFVILNNKTVKTYTNELFINQHKSDSSDTIHDVPEISEYELNDLKITNSSSDLQMRSLEACISMFQTKMEASELTDEEIMLLLNKEYINIYQIEEVVGDAIRGVKIRRKFVAKNGDLKGAFNKLPYKHYDYSKLKGTSCENVIGYVPVPVGIVGPLVLDGKKYYIPIATTEGCLVASINRGCKALLRTGIKTQIVADGMTRGPVVRFPSLTNSSKVLEWIEKPKNFKKIKSMFDSTSRFASLTKIRTRSIGRLLFIRFVAKTGDAMGMNMLSKGTEVALKYIQQQFPEMELLSLSGNYCTDKKAAAVNWIEGRGKSVICETVLPEKIVNDVLKTTVDALIDLNISKNLIGSAVAGSIGGYNAHAANIITAIFIATGQDPAQNISSSNCMTIMERWGPKGADLYVSCTMPSIEIGTVGGGTNLAPQAACLDILGVQGPNHEVPGDNAKRFARIICGAVLAGELSLIAALTAGHLVKSHLKYNRPSSK